MWARPWRMSSSAIPLPVCADLLYRHRPGKGGADGQRRAHLSRGCRDGGSAQADEGAGDHRCLAGSTVECKQRIYERYRRTGCTVKIYDYPSEGEENIPTKQVLRDFRIEDLLFRDTIEVENPETKAFYAGKTVLVSAAAAGPSARSCTRWQLCVEKTGDSRMLRGTTPTTCSLGADQ